LVDVEEVEVLDTVDEVVTLDDDEVLEDFVEVTNVVLLALEELVAAVVVAILRENKPCRLSTACMNIYEPVPGMHW
jgi:hypothetical protein